MARKQLQIAGTERKANKDVEAAADAYIEARDERMDLSKREKQKKLELIAVMQANKIKSYKFDDAEGEELKVAIEDKLDVSVRKTGEAESHVGEGMPEHNGVDGGVPQGLIDEALKGQSDVGVVVTAEGDVVPPETSAPKGKKPRWGKPKKQKAKSS